MMKNRFQSKAIVLVLILSLLIAFLISIMNLSFFASAETIAEEKNDNTLLNTNSKSEYDIEKVTKELLGDLTIGKCEYLYNLDDSADYIYVEFENGGYAIFLKQTMEMMEYSVRGKLDFAGSISRKYYGGPNSYLIRENEYFIDTTSNQRLYISQELAQNYSNQIRENMMVNYNARSNLEAIEYDYSSVDSSISCYEIKDTTSEVMSSTPSLDEDYFIFISETMGTYIENYQYFLHAPKHGLNTSGTCGAVAAQLLLSYHNYYTDRRLIDNKYLNGDESNKYQNPNLCTDPMTMTPNTLGTRGIKEDGSDDVNSYFAYVVNKIPKSATLNNMVSGLLSIFSERNHQISGKIDYALSSKDGGWFFGILPVDTSKVISEIKSGRPSIITMNKSLGGSNHALVAYGYCNYTYPGSTDSYSGFITHYGWSTSDINVWVNSAWCNGYITLSIAHKHNYNTVGSIGSDPCRVESKCTECGHRTDAYINMLANDRYIERTVTLPQNEYTYKDYYVSFATAGYKLFQTMGRNDAKLYLYDMQNKQLMYDDDSGYKLNSLFSYSVVANTQYRLRVQFYNDSTYGDVKIGIMPIISKQEKYEDVWGPFNPGSVTSGTTYKGAMVLTRYSVSTEGEYVFYTKKSLDSESITDMYLYLIDPTSTKEVLYNDDGAGNLQAKIIATLKPGIEYLLITTTYNIQNNGLYMLYFDSV